MPCDRPDCVKCVHHGQEAWACPAGCSREHTTECLQHPNFLSESMVSAVNNGMLPT